ncbi:capsule polysaccharide biosynthesis protein [Mytilinidion resinicola]|uniref:Capsule polysaccharide biosynthesis protein n=1 Tax=Mytilinidion resinicola TaxID=574789 RepID=A0A6A6XZI0_9PEZI|nr:capsule polysaccharide biosynthesis protein [Mytilinidion resinicola]KAF2801698.1 capsule polysaccharide biosynthesis protein [Mytilinidion resinicola]
MASLNPNYPIPPGLHPIPPSQLDLRPDAEVDQTLLNPPPISPHSEKNIWFFWHAGYPSMHPYTQRNIRAWHRRFSPAGWVIRVLDRAPSSPLNIANFLDVADPLTFPAAFCDGTIGGAYAPQHTSDLVRWPLLLRYGGVYADVGLLHIGDLDRLWRTTIGDPASRFEVLSYDGGGSVGRGLANYFLASSRGNALFARCHALLLKLWEGRTSTEGLHASPLLKGVPHLGGHFSIEEEGKPTIGPAEAGRMLTDYIIQGQVMTMVMGLVDEEGGWDGPRYVEEHVFGIEFMVGAQLINELTAWDGQLAFRLMSLKLPKEGEAESEEQKRAREIVETILSKSFGFKLAHGMILKAYKYTLGSLWRENEGSDDVPGTYAHWLRYAMVYWNQDEIPPTVEYKRNEPYKVGPLLREV